MEGDGGVSTEKKCIEAGSCNFRGRRVIKLDVLANNNKCDNKSLIITLSG